MLIIKKINDVQVSPSIIDDSRANGYELTEHPQVQQLARKWLSDKKIEIYTCIHDRQVGRAKSSEYDGNGDYIQQYNNTYHTRLSGNNDPILIIKLLISENETFDLWIGYISDHNQMFGKGYEKCDPKRMREIRNSNVDKLP